MHYISERPCLIQEHVHMVGAQYNEKELFKKQAVTVAYYGAGEKNKGVACFETEDLNAFMEILESTDTAEAMSHDGIIDGTVEIFVLDSILEI